MFEIANTSKCYRNYQSIITKFDINYEHNNHYKRTVVNLINTTNDLNLTNKYIFTEMNTYIIHMIK